MLQKLCGECSCRNAMGIEQRAFVQMFASPPPPPPRVRSQDLMSFLAGFISELAQAVQSVAPAVGDLQYCMGQAMGNAASTVVGNMLGEGSHRAAKRAARLLMVLAVVIMLVQLVAFLILRTHVARLFTRKDDILAGIVELLPFSLAFSFMDSLQAVMCDLGLAMFDSTPQSFWSGPSTNPSPIQKLYLSYVKVRCASLGLGQWGSGSEFRASKWAITKASSWSRLLAVDPCTSYYDTTCRCFTRRVNACFRAGRGEP